MNTLSKVSSKRVFLFVLFLFLFLVLFFQRQKFLYIDNFMNNDLIVATYNADLLLEGKIPYIDSYEKEKPPLLFFVFVLLFKFIG